MTSRVLPPSEYPKLAGTEAASVWPRLPDTAEVLVVEDEGAILGCWVAMPILHAECLWIAPAHRGKAGVGRRLFRAMREAVTRAGASAVMTCAMTDDVRHLLQTAHATPLGGDHFMLPMRRAR